MNKADPDCGTSFTWVTKAMGPQLGWLTGWAIVAADIVVMATLAYIAGVYTFLLFGWDAGADSPARGQHRRRSVWIVVMTWICYVGIEISARTQYFLLAMEIVDPGAVRGRRAGQGLRRQRPAGSIDPSLEWLNPFGMLGAAPLVDGVLLGVFIYWGWDSGVCVNEESEDSANGPGKAAVMSTILLVVIYVVVAVRGAGVRAARDFLRHNKDDVLERARRRRLRLAARQAADHRGADLGLGLDPDDDPADRADDAVDGALRSRARRRSGDIHPRYLTPGTSTLLMGAVSLVWTLIIINVSTRTCSATRSPALGFQIAFYYGLTGFACAIYYRSELFKSVKNFFMVGLAPFARRV